MNEYTPSNKIREAVNEVLKLLEEEDYLNAIFIAYEKEGCRGLSITIGKDRKRMIQLLQDYLDDLRKDENSDHE